MAGNCKTRKAAVDASRALIQVPVTLKHLVWQRAYHDQGEPVSEEWISEIAANEGQMWARGMAEEPDYNPTVGVESHEVMGVRPRLAHHAQMANELPWPSKPLVGILAFVVMQLLCPLARRAAACGRGALIPWRGAGH